MERRKAMKTTFLQKERKLRRLLSMGQPVKKVHSDDYEDKAQVARNKAEALEERKRKRE